METFEYSKELRRKTRSKFAMREFKIAAVAIAAGGYTFCINDGFAFGEYWLWASMASTIVAAVAGNIAEKYFD